MEIKKNNIVVYKNNLNKEIILFIASDIYYNVKMKCKAVLVSIWPKKQPEVFPLYLLQNKCYTLREQFKNFKQNNTLKVNKIIWKTRK